MTTPVSASSDAFGNSLYADLPGDIAISFEFFPPRTEAMEKTLWDSIKTLETLQPDFVSVTYGAGGSTRERTHATVGRIVRETSLKPAAHLTCVNASRSEIAEIADEYWNAGVRHIVALRGDPPVAGEPFSTHPDGHANAAELVESLAALHPFEISVAAYPELHPEAISAKADIDFLKRKFDAGATRAISQFFFDPDTFLRFQDEAAKAGIEDAIIPGILPITNVAQTRKMAAMCGTNIPAWMDRLFEGLDNHPAARQLIAATVTAELCRRLYAGGVRHFHFYTLNRAELAYAICHLLGVRGTQGIEKVAA